MVTSKLAPGVLPPGQRIYAIGDVHGRCDLLVSLHHAIMNDLATRPVPAPLVIHLGDAIDRGPDSAGVIAHLVAGAPRPAGLQLPRVNLMGNHEAMLLHALDGGGPGAVAHWLRNGGIASLESWGVHNLTDPQAWLEAIPPAHVALLRGLALSYHAGDYFFAHAGVRPGVPLAQQSAEDLLWIREPFLSATVPFGAVVVHGHTPAAAPVIRPNRIGIDTAAAMGGVLTCVVLEADRIGFIQR